MRPLPHHEAAPMVACVLAAGEAQHRLAIRSLSAPRKARMGRPGAVEELLPCPADFGLSAHEAGMWGRLRADGLSDQDAADAVKAARGRREP